MQNKKLGAVIVTYNPTENLSELLKKLDLVDEVIIVDNNSINKKELELYCQEYSKLINIYNEENEGLAKSYNKAEQIFSKEIEWFFTFDQDSLPDNDMIHEIKKFIKADENLGKIGIIIPEIIDKNIKSKIKIDSGETTKKYVKEAIQSGMCIKREIIKKVGGFEEDLFMYYVDTDFVNKVLKYGYSIIKLKNAILYHEDGKLQKKKLIFNFNVNERSKIADYYRARNLVYMTQKYGCKYLKDILYDFFVKTIFSKNRREYYKNTFKGLKDGVKRFC